MRRFFFYAIVWGYVIVASVLTSASAHEVRPGVLKITQTDADHFDVLWKQPANGDVAIRLVPKLSSGALAGPPSMESDQPGFALKVWKGLSQRAVPLDGQTLSVEGLDRTITDVLVTVALQDGKTLEHVLNPRQASIRLDLSSAHTPLATGYFRLGVEHILTGIDHLLFVLGLLLLVGWSWSLLKTVTAFTIAHSVTLAASALGWIHVRSAVVESLVALSIVILAVELVRRARGEGGFTSRFPWVIAFAFGLLHGCAFAGALAEIGLPQQDVPLALLLFNVGVEVGQLLFIFVAVAVMHALRRLFSAAPQAWTRLAIPYAIGGFAAHWFFDRLITGFSGASLT